MDHSLRVYNQLPVEKYLGTELAACNRLSSRYGLSLTMEQMMALHQKRLEALKNTRRIEFGPGILPKLVEAFCDSPYISSQNYEETLWELQDAFYYFKHESMEALSDDELVGYMAAYFNGVCQGSLDYLTGTSLENLCWGIRGGEQPEEQGGDWEEAEEGED